MIYGKFRCIRIWYHLEFRDRQTLHSLRAWRNLNGFLVTSIQIAEIAECQQAIHRALSEGAGQIPSGSRCKVNAKGRISSVRGCEKVDRYAPLKRGTETVLPRAYQQDSPAKVTLMVNQTPPTKRARVVSSIDKGREKREGPKGKGVASKSHAFCHSPSISDEFAGTCYYLLYTSSSDVTHRYRPRDTIDRSRIAKRGRQQFSMFPRANC